jgi:hypothetical protein
MVIVIILVVGLAAFLSITQSSATRSSRSATASVNPRTATVTEEIIQETIYSQEGCTDNIAVSNSTAYLIPSLLSSQTFATVTVTQMSSTFSTTSVSPPPIETRVVNGTTLTELCSFPLPPTR